MNVVIDGVTYAPISERQASIGVAITTRNRPEMIRRSREAWAKFLPPGAVLFVVDDASDAPVEGASFRFKERAGIAAAKNKCLELLMDAGVEHLFLFDDDAWPKTEDWWKPYVEGPEPH